MKTLTTLLKKHFQQMGGTNPETQEFLNMPLFMVNIDKDKLWNLYLDSFPEGTNEIYRERREYDCSACKHFVFSLGGLIAINNHSGLFDVISIWDVIPDDLKFNPSFQKMSEYVKTSASEADSIGLFKTEFKRIGIPENNELYNGEVITYHHMFLDIPKEYIVPEYNLGTVKGNAKTSKEVFKSSLESITQESIDIVLDMIEQDSLYRGPEFKDSIVKFSKYLKLYNEIKHPDEYAKELFAWKYSLEAGEGICRIKNHAIGTLLVNISEEKMSFESAVYQFEKVFMATENYKRSKPVFSPKQLAEANAFVEQEGLEPSLYRRMATSEDITVNNVLFKDGTPKHTTGFGIGMFNEMKSEAVVKPREFNKIEEITIETFVNKVLPTATQVELYLENKFKPNLMTLIAPVNPDAKNLFKWNNNFSWAYTGNLADSTKIKESVKTAGGSVDAVLRFSIMWNDKSTWDQNDLDAHCVEPGGHRIYFGDKRSNSSGVLDVDIISPDKGISSVENITWSDISKMPKGTYKMLVMNYNNKGGKEGFSAEIEFNGQIFEFEYPKEVKHKESILVAEVMFDGTSFTISPKIDHNQQVKKYWNVSTNQFVPVKMIMNSPNYWDGQEIGNKHYFFIVDGMENRDSLNGFYNEFLRNDLHKFRRIFEALGSKTAVKLAINQPQVEMAPDKSEERKDLLMEKLKGESLNIYKRYLAEFDTKKCLKDLQAKHLIEQKAYFGHDPEVFKEFRVDDITEAVLTNTLSEIDRNAINNTLTINNLSSNVYTKFKNDAFDIFRDLAMKIQFKPIILAVRDKENKITSFLFIEIDSEESLRKEYDMGVKKTKEGIYIGVLQYHTVVKPIKSEEWQAILMLDKLFKIIKSTTHLFNTDMYRGVTSALDIPTIFVGYGQLFPKPLHTALHILLDLDKHSHSKRLRSFQIMYGLLNYNLDIRDFFVDNIETEQEQTN